jgi:hypothetical protein
MYWHKDQLCTLGSLLTQCQRDWRNQICKGEKEVAHLERFQNHTQLTTKAFNCSTVRIRRDKEISSHHIEDRQRDIISSHKSVPINGSWNMLFSFLWDYRSLG